MGIQHTQSLVLFCCVAFLVILSVDAAAAADDDDDDAGDSDVDVGADEVEEEEGGGGGESGKEDRHLGRRSINLNKKMKELKKRVRIKSEMSTLCAETIHPHSSPLQVDDMLQEIRNQNHAIFKHADHNRILSGKVSEMSKEIKGLRKDKTALEEKLQLQEFKVAKKVRKIKTRLANADTRLGKQRQRKECPHKISDMLTNMLGTQHLRY